MAANPFPENLAPAGKSLRQDFVRAVIKFAVEFGYTPMMYPPPPQGKPIVRKIDMRLNPDRVPTFIARRLPIVPPDGFSGGYRLTATDYHPHDTTNLAVRFEGSLSIIRTRLLSAEEARRERWSVHYDINSPRRQVWRRVEGEQLTGYSIENAMPQSLPNTQDIRDTFPRKFAVTEAWQLIRLLESDPRPPEDIYRPGLVMF